MTDPDMLAEMERLRAGNESSKAQGKKAMYLKVREKGLVVVRTC
jgi:hypothetical protein